jgi:mRNA-degrading endonuclease YafQ of YafQ-DinJ toxin-antitoxin module
MAEQDLKVTVRFGPSFEKSLKAYKKSGNFARISKQLDRFIAHKMSQPTEPFGGNDKNAAPRYPKFMKAHLTHDDSVIYRYDGQTRMLRIYGIWSHDDLGIGQPPRPAASVAMNDTLLSQVFETRRS